MNSREKGARGERELARFLRDYGYDAFRSQQYCGLSGDADVTGVPYLHVECKRVEQLNVEKALLQAERDHKRNTIPTVMHRRNNESWKVTLRLKDFMEIWNAIPEYKRLEVAQIISEKDGLK